VLLMYSSNYFIVHM